MDNKKLVQYLESIGQEIHEPEFVGTDGVIRPITKDEQLAREVWKRALGYEKESVNADGHSSHRVFDPDPKAQAFIFERREGKNAMPDEDKGLSLLEKISDLALGEVNEMTEQVTTDGDSE